MKHKRGKWRDTPDRRVPFCSQDYIPDFIDYSVYKPYQDKSLLQQKYLDEGLSASQIASQIFCSKATVQKQLREAGVPSRSPHQHHEHPSQPKYGEKTTKGRTTAHLGEHRVIRTAVEMRDQGLSLRQIARFLSQIGVPTKQRGKVWHPEMIKRLLIRNLD